ncbi:MULTISPECIES: hypothetical protein [unclassified Rhodococcus (in: high G+C Gram-positive bacteria)]|uniref:hypothetical protein n=1 Tax=unclassified Rhodococcus (in: high G+C Gram-positive bacteria) TaxID=192944 RepID=UPI00096AAD85|nr:MULTISPECIES: hypothetical protein [unclassified Rhodococcus (in: high G+C Gram-positive bacteria)]
MSTIASTRSLLADRINSLAAIFTSDTATKVKLVLRQAWWLLRPAVRFALRVAAFMVPLGFSRWVDLDSIRADFVAAAGTSHPTPVAAFDASDAVLQAAEAIGSSAAAATYVWWLAWLAATCAILLSAVSILASPQSNPSPLLTRSLARLPRYLVQDIAALLIACAILAHLAGESTYLSRADMWLNAALLAAVLWATIGAEKRWMRTSPSFPLLPASLGRAQFTDRSDLTRDIPADEATDSPGVRTKHIEGAPRPRRDADTTLEN